MPQRDVSGSRLATGAGADPGLEGLHLADGDAQALGGAMHHGGPRIGEVERGGGVALHGG
jgi:hypothetical protein